MGTSIRLASQGPEQLLIGNGGGFIPVSSETAILLQQVLDIYEISPDQYIAAICRDTLENG